MVADMHKEIVEKDRQIEELNAKIREYEEFMKPYRELSEAEARKKTEEAKLQAKKAEEEQAKKEKEEKRKEQAAAEAQRKAREQQEKQGYDSGITYSQLERTPDEYEDKKIKFKGKVIQAIHGEENITQLLIAVAPYYEKTLWAVFKNDITPSRVLKGDIITVYGIAKGIYTYESVGGVVSIPLMKAEKIDRHNP